MAQGIKGSALKCSVQGCGRIAHARGWCSTHYRRWAKHGDPAIKGQDQLHGLAIVERFWAHVDKEGHLPEYCPELGPCWLWMLQLDSRGYGRFWDGTRRPFAHDFAYELLVGPVPDGLELDHLCRVPACVNPAHLEAVTHRVNVLRGVGFMAQQARKTHCKRGHLLAGDNIYDRGGRKRDCRICRRELYWQRKLGGMP